MFASCCLFSANLSKAAWGALEKKDSQLAIRSYEIGVLFLPSQANGDTQGFSVGHMTEECASMSEEEFPLPYDVPPVPYEGSDEPWVWDKVYTERDSHNQMWIP